MQLGMIGLGRMGGNIVRRLMKAGHSCVVYDRSADAVASLVGDGAVGATGLADMVAKLDAPCAVWVMLPAGAATESAVTELASHMKAGDVVIDGGNSNYKDAIRRAALLRPKGIGFVDVGTSGGVWGLERGYCMMIGGDTEVVDRLDPIFATLAPGAGDIVATKGRDGRDPRPEHGYLHAGSNGAGHYVKMIHNGIEYGMMQAFAEGFDILRSADSADLTEEMRIKIDVADVAEVWRRGSVITSWLLDLTASALAEDVDLSKFSGFVEDSGEGRWTVNAAIEQSVPADVLTAALYARFRSRGKADYANKVLSAMRMGFGGHVEPKTAAEPKKA